jgi:predicted dehydrogenase
LAQPTLGEKFIVFGMGLLGLLTVQLLRSSGCEVMVVDLNSSRLMLAEAFGAQTVDVKAGADTILAAQSWTGGRGVDGVIITAAAKNDTIMHQAAESCRKRGRIILVGVVGLNLHRSDFYKKELTFQVSCSYGPGRYDEEYEQAGQDYPYGFVRWTEQRNFEAVLAALQTSRLRVEEMITHRYHFEDALSAYDVIREDSNALGVVLHYPYEVDRAPALRMVQERSVAAGEVAVGVIGAGGFANAVLLPALSRTNARLMFIADLNAASAAHAAKKFGADQAVTDHRIVLNDPTVNVVFILVGHHLHAPFVCEALKLRKHVFVEKPLAVNEQQLQDVTGAVENAAGQLLMVGFNRRFSPHTVKIRDMLAGRAEPLCMNMTINAGMIPAEHWTQDPERGGGRIVGEACHFIDLLSYISESLVKSVSAMMVGHGPAVREDKMSIVLGFADGSVGTVNYFANGSKGYPKETLEVFSDNRVLKMQNFRITRGYGFKRFRKFTTVRQNKGHNAEVAAFIRRITSGGEPLIRFNQLSNVTKASFAAMKSAKENRTVTL